MKRILFLLISLFFTYNSILQAQTEEICPGSVPDGWIIISYRACAGCCGGKGIVYMPTIKKIEDLPTGTELEICPQDIPRGWVIISKRACAGCCGGNGIIYMPTIKKIKDSPIGTTLEICPQETPKGWLVVSTRSCAGCCGGSGIIQMPTIKKVDNNSYRNDDNTNQGAQTMEVCPGEIPRGWVIISTRSCAGCCGGSGIVQMPTIKNIDDSPIGTTLEVCPQVTPTGWVVISTRSCAGCCGGNGIVQMPTIKKISERKRYRD